MVKDKKLTKTQLKSIFESLEKIICNLLLEATEDEGVEIKLLNGLNIKRQVKAPKKYKDAITGEEKMCKPKMWVTAHITKHFNHHFN